MCVSSGLGWRSEGTNMAGLWNNGTGKAHNQCFLSGWYILWIPTIGSILMINLVIFLKFSVIVTHKSSQYFKKYLKTDLAFPSLLQGVFEEADK